MWINFVSWKCNIKHVEKILNMGKISEMKMQYKRFKENFIFWKNFGQKYDIKNFWEQSLKPRIYERAKWFGEPLVNGLPSKCLYMWMELQTYSVPSTNGSHTVRRKPKFVGFLCEHEENWIRLHALGTLCSPQVRGKLINRPPLTCRMRTVQRVSGALVYTKLYSNNATTGGFLAYWVICAC